MQESNRASSILTIFLLFSFKFWSLVTSIPMEVGDICILLSSHFDFFPGDTSLDALRSFSALFCRVPRCLDCLLLAGSLKDVSAAVTSSSPSKMKSIGAGSRFEAWTISDDEYLSRKTQVTQRSDRLIGVIESGASTTFNRSFERRD
jgi:hypothetical protein